jgi:hypothetical protein
MKNLRKLSNQKIVNLHEIKGGDGEYKQEDIWTGPYQETGELDEGNRPKTKYIDGLGQPRTDIKILGIVIKINPSS